jgi:hypothetical protein
MNGDGVKFCRSCGKELATIAKAMTGELTSAPRKPSVNPRHEIWLERGVRESYTGVGLIIAGIILSATRQSWGIWLVVAGVIVGGKGFAQLMTTLISSKRDRRRSRESRTARLAEKERERFEQIDRIQPPPPTGIGDLLPDRPSVTEGTTRSMDSTASRRGDHG